MSSAPVLSAPDTAILTHVPELSPAALSATAAARQQPAEQLYDVAATAARLAALAPQPQRIVLQFPDEALCDAVPVFWGLTRELQARKWAGRLFIGADTSYGNCCVDEVAAQHVDADMVVHYGHACLSPTQRLPVLYVFPKLAIEPEQAASALAAGVPELLSSSGPDEPAPKAVLLLFDVAYAHAAPSVHAELRKQLQAQGISTPLVLSSVECEGNTGASGSRLPATGCCGTSAAARGCGCESTCQEAPRPPPAASPEDVSRLSGSGTGVGAGRRYELPDGADLRSSAVIYLGGESLALTNLLLRLGPTSRMLSYDPRRPAGAEVRREDGRTNRLLMRRYAAVQKARDANVIALLVGTLGVAAYLPLLAHLREKLVARGRRVYTISVGKLTPAKLANYAEIDVFVLLACPENSLVDAIDATRSRDFFKPIVSPFEMLHALKDEEDGGREWSGDYVLDLDRLAPAAQPAASSSSADDGQEELEVQAGQLSLAAQDPSEPTADEEESSDEEPQFSLITGGYVSRPKRAGKNGSGVRQIDGAASAGVVTVRSADGSLTRVLDSAAGAHLAQRSWRGLETRTSADAPSVLGRGRAGIAGGYADAGGTSEGKEGVGAITREQTQAGQQ